MQNPVTISTFYHFTMLSERAKIKAQLLPLMRSLGIKGTLTLAPEGVNATIAGAADALSRFVSALCERCGIGEISQRTSAASVMPFGKSKVKLKPELISLGAPSHPAVCVGEYVHPSDWNALISRPDVITIDTRNDYEYRIGHFVGAMNPATRDFKEMVHFTKTHLDPKRHPHVAMYCTGGIRCEKYSSYLLMQGFERVYHLQGGILAYLETTAPEQSLWRGDCYVFDERVAVGHGLVASPDVSMCLGCGQPLYSADRCHPLYREGEACPYCAKALAA